MDASPPCSFSSHKTNYCCRTIACGYKSIYIAKSQLSFPAWLVDFSSFSPNNTSSRTSSSSNNNNNSNSTSSPTTGYGDHSLHGYYYWRSKRDFLQLSRAVSQHSDSNLAFPRAAFRKLSEQAPWIRPDHDDDSLPLENNNKNNNQWKPFMKKSLNQLDRYLDHVQSLIVSTLHTNATETTSAHENDLALIRAWKDFSRPQDCSSNGKFEQESESKHYSSDTMDQSQSLDTTGPFHDNNHAARGNALGQYFCHPQIAHQLVHCCLDKLKQQMLQHHHIQKPNIIFIEPSCGHGQVLQTLCHVLEQQQQNQGKEKGLHHLGSIRIIGIDMDETAVSHCLQKFGGYNLPQQVDQNQHHHLDRNSINNHTETDTFNDTGNNNEIHLDQKQGNGELKMELSTPSSFATAFSVPPQFYAANFLLSRRSDYMHQGHHDTGNDGNSTDVVIVLGGPPYSAGAGSCRSVTNDGEEERVQCFSQHGSVDSAGPQPATKLDTKTATTTTIHNNLPLQFVRHAMDEYQATVVAFIMPQRCAKIPLHDMQLPNDDYDLETFALEGPSTFFFQGQRQQMVHQPSIIQVFWKK
ncbi:hypothetical protein ACA910_009946 [Epithemia clementina (nom. ined.)]